MSLPDDAAASRWRYPALLLMLVVILAAVTLPEIVRLPEPRHYLAFDRALFTQGPGQEVGTGSGQTVELPTRWVFGSGPLAAVASYRLRLAPDSLPDGKLVLFIPAARQTVEAYLNGQPLPAMPRSVWSSTRSGYSYAAALPREFLRGEAANELDIRLVRTDGWFAGYLSRVYISAPEDIARYRRTTDLMIEQWRGMTFALHLVTFAGFITILLFRHRDPVFRWLAALMGLSLAIVASQSPIIGEQLGGGRHIIMAGVAAVGLLAVGVALTLTGRRCPRWLRRAIGIVPLALILAGAAGVSSLAAVIAVSTALAILSYGVAGAILVRGFAARGGWEVGLLAVPFILTAWFGGHDVAMGLGLNDSAFMLAPYMRTLTLTVLMIVLMGRLAQSLNLVDQANDLLGRRLAEREAELTTLHERERRRAEQSVLERERQRLMSDLHDGLSGHLVSIMALAENGKADRASISSSAREALDDLALVVHSLDIGDSDLLVALAGWRERFAPRLRRIGVELDWSMEALPVITGVTPGKALAVLRILQEAVTNALKHGPATRIAIHGRPHGNGAVITVENDRSGPPSAVGKGCGLGNMQKRAQSFGATLCLDLKETHACLELRLPVRLQGGQAARNCLSG